MAFRRPIVLLGIIVFLLARVPAEATCPAISSYDSVKKEARQVRVEPSRPFKEGVDPLKVVAVLLREYLSRARPPKQEVTIRVDAVPTGRGQFQVIAMVGEKRFQAPLTFPDNLNEALVGLTETITQELKTPIKGKKLLPFLNETPWATAYLRYADGVLAMEGLGDKKSLNREDAERAAAAFEEAVKADYNYVSAYAGLAEALAAQAALTGLEPLRLKSKVAMEKAKLLNPYRAKSREPRMAWYLKAGCPTK